MRVLLLATDVETRNYYITLAILDALKREPRVEHAVLATHGDALMQQNRHRCDCIFAVGGARHQSALLAQLCRTSATSILWTSEDPYEIGGNLEYSKCFDYVFTNDSACVDAYGGRATALPFAASTLFHDYPVLQSDESYRYDLCFVGTAWPNRVSTLNKILGPFRGNLRTKIALPGNEFLPKPMLAFSDLDIEWRSSNTNFARLSNVSRVTLTLERDFTTAEGGRGVAETPPPRLFETALAGGNQILLSQNDAAERYFLPTREITICHDEAEIEHAIREALRDPATRMERAKAARSRTQREHLYDHRIGTILDRIEAQPITRPSVPARSKKRNVLVVTHNLHGVRQGGGVEVYQEELPRMAGNFEFAFLMPVHQEGDHAFHLRRADGSFRVYHLPGYTDTFALTDDHAEAAFQRVLRENDIDLVHFQHLIGYPLSLPLIAASCGVPTIWTIHDYYLICKRFNLINFAGRFCDIANVAKTNCDICLNATEDLPQGSQARRRSFVSHVVRRIDAFIASTPYSGDYLRKIYPEISADKLHVIEMLIPRIPVPASSDPARSADQEPLQVVIPGNFTEGKGAHQLIRLMNIMRQKNLHFTILGFVEPDFAAILQALEIENLSQFGKYNSAEAARLLSRFDVSLHLSIWPETYMITLSEAWVAGVVPIVSQLGASGERVTDGLDGFVVEPYDIGGVVELLEKLVANRSQLQSLRDEIGRKQPVRPTRHLAELRALYEGLMARNPIAHISSRQHRKQEGFLSTRGTGIRTNHAFWSRSENVWDESGTESTKAVPLRISDSLPKQFARLPMKFLDGTDPSEARLEIDECLADGVIALKRNLRADRELYVRGWAFQPGHGGLVSAFLRLEGRDGVVQIIPLLSEAREDVSAVLEDADAFNCGFTLSLDLRFLREGYYEVGLMQAYDKLLLRYVNVCTLLVDRGSEKHAPDSAMPKSTTPLSG